VEVFTGVAFTRLAGYVSEKATFVSWLSGLRFVMVNDNVDGPFTRIGFGENCLEITGGDIAVKVSVAEPSGPVFVPVSVEEINPLTLVCGPAVVAVTSTWTVQNPFVVPTLPGIVPPVGFPNVRLVAPPAGAQVGEPPQVVLAAGVAATSTPEGNVSVNVSPVKETLFSLVIVNVNVDVPLTAIGSGENVLVSEGGYGTPQPVTTTLSR